MKFKHYLILTVLLLGFYTIAHFFLRATSLPQDNNQKNQITTSFYPLYYFASVIGGDKVNVVNITPAGAEPHDYEPSSQDIIQIMNSKVLFLNGLVEPWGQKMQNNLLGKSTRVVTIGSDLMTQTILDEKGDNSLDPHVWLSPVLAKQIVAKITLELSSTDPINKQYYQENGSNLQVQLNQLDQEYRTSLQNCQTKDIVTSHAAFGYLANTYGLKQISIAGLSPDAEPSLKQLAQITNFAKSNQVKYIFFESLVSPKLANTLAQEVGAQTLVLNPLEGLSQADLLAGKTYFTEMKNNLQNLRTALQCQ